MPDLASTMFSFNNTTDSPQPFERVVVFRGQKTDALDGNRAESQPVRISDKGWSNDAIDWLANQLSDLLLVEDVGCTPTRGLSAKPVHQVR